MSEDKTNQNFKQDIPPIYSEGWQEQIAEKAKRIGYIHLSNLEIILAVDVQYIPHLPRLYMEFKGAKSLGDSPDFSTFGSRFNFWNYFLVSLAPSNSELPWYKDHGGSPISFPPLYLFNVQTKEYEKRTGLDRVRAGSDAFVNLEDLRRFLENLQLPLPSLIFPGSLNEAGEKLKRGSLEGDSDLTGLKQTYVFARTGPTWEIIFDGRRISGLNEKGWKYIHYLVEHPKKEFFSSDLAALDGITPTENEEKAETESHLDAQQQPHMRLGDEHIKNLKKKRDDYLKEIEEAKGNSDFEKASVYEQKVREINKATLEYVNSKKPSVKSELKKATERIGKAIHRAVNEMKLHDIQAWNHFKQALSPFRSSLHSYHPINQVPWDLS